MLDDTDVHSPKRIKLDANSEPFPADEHHSQLNGEGEDQDDHRENCSICLSNLEDRTVIPTCSHEFCFECLVVWAGQSRRCPLCNQPIGEYLIHNIRSRYDYSKHYLTPLRTSPPPAHTSSAVASRRDIFRRQRRERQERMRRTQDQLSEVDRFDRSLAKRRWIYRHDLYAKHVASNSYTKFRPYPKPSQFAASSDLISRTTAFIRRELQVWEGLDVEFLTTMIISLMKSIDIRSESAVKLISEFLDLDAPYAPGNRQTYAEHFAHEVYSYVRSPYKDLFVYDSIVQYDVPDELQPPEEVTRRRRWHEASRSRSCSPEFVQGSSRRTLGNVNAPERSTTPPGSRDRHPSLNEIAGNRVVGPTTPREHPAVSAPGHSHSPVGTSTTASGDAKGKEKAAATAGPSTSHTPTTFSAPALLDTSSRRDTPGVGIPAGNRSQPKRSALAGIQSYLAGTTISHQSPVRPPSPTSVDKISRAPSPPASTTPLSIRGASSSSSSAGGGRASLGPGSSSGFSIKGAAQRTLAANPKPTSDSEARLNELKRRLAAEKATRNSTPPSTIDVREAELKQRLASLRKLSETPLSTPSSGTPLYGSSSNASPLESSTPDSSGREMELKQRLASQREAASASSNTTAEQRLKKRLLERLS